MDGDEAADMLEEDEGGETQAGQQPGGLDRCVKYDIDLFERASGRLIDTETTVKEITLETEEGEQITIDLFEASSFIPTKYVKVGKNGFLADEEGNLVNDDGAILTSRDELAELLFRIQNGE